MRKAVASVITGLGLTAGITIGAPVAAHAYSPDPDVRKTYVETSDCRGINWDCFDDDPAGGTWFEYDKGGVGTKMELWHKGKFVGTVEFHPYDEFLRLHDTRNDEDTFYVTATYIEDGRTRKSHLRISKNPVRKDMSIKDGTLVDVAVYDNGYEKDLIGRTNARA